MLRLLRTLLFGLWVGSLAGFAFIFAPIAFAHIGPTPQFAATIAANVRALVRVGDWFAIAAAAITLVGKLESRRAAAAIIGCIALAIVMGYVETVAIVPQMERTALLTPAYAALHRESSAVYGTAFLAALAAFIIAARRAR